MGERGAVPAFEVPPEPGRRTAVEVFWFDLSHERVALGPHTHRDLEILYFVRGGGEHRVSCHVWPACPGDVILIPPGQVHDLAGISDDARGWALEFSGVEDLGAVAPSLLLWRANPLLNTFVAAEMTPEIGRFNVPVPVRPRWEQHFADLARELQERPFGHRHAVSALMLLLLVDVARLAEDIPRTMRAHDEPVLAQVFEVIDARFSERLTLRDVADEVGLTPGYLTALVRKRTGRTVLDWILERRLAEARSLLLGTELTVELIADRVGFDDPTYFSRRFRRSHAIPPGAWRAAARV